MIQRSPLRLAVVVGAVGAGQEAQAVVEGRQPVQAEGVGRACGEPGQRARAASRQHHARLPGGAQRLVQPVGPPDSQHARRVAAAHEHQVLIADELLQIVHRALEEPQPGDPGALGREAVGMVRRVAGSRGDQADADAPPAGGSQHVVDQRMDPARQRRQAAEGDDAAPVGHGEHLPGMTVSTASCQSVRPRATTAATGLAGRTPRPSPGGGAAPLKLPHPPPGARRSTRPRRPAVHRPSRSRTRPRAA